MYTLLHLLLGTEHLLSIANRSICVQHLGAGTRIPTLRETARRLLKCNDSSFSSPVN